MEFDPPQKTNDHLPDTLVNLVEAALQQRGKPDQGLWEMPGASQVMLHSQAMIWVAVTCAAAIGRRIGHPAPSVLEEWERTGRELREEYLRRGWNEAAQAYTMAEGSTALDASVLRLVIFKAIDAHDPRLLKTLAAVERELGAGDLLYRYRVDDTLEGQEGTFTACAFWRVGVLAMAGRTSEASALFEGCCRVATTWGCSRRRSTRPPGSKGGTSRRRSRTWRWSTTRFGCRRWARQRGPRPVEVKPVRAASQARSGRFQVASRRGRGAGGDQDNAPSAPGPGCRSGMGTMIGRVADDVPRAAGSGRQAPPSRQGTTICFWSSQMQ